MYLEASRDTNPQQSPVTCCRTLLPRCMCDLFPQCDGAASAHTSLRLPLICSSRQEHVAGLPPAFWANTASRHTDAIVECVCEIETGERRRERERERERAEEKTGGRVYDFMSSVTGYGREFVKTDTEADVAHSWSFHLTVFTHPGIHSVTLKQADGHFCRRENTYGARRTTYTEDISH